MRSAAQMHTPAVVAKAAASRRARLDGVVAALHADYMAGASFYALEKKHGRNRRVIRELFQVRGLYIRPFDQPAGMRREKGAFVAATPLTAEQLDALIARATRIGVPAELKNEWRDWPLPRRVAFIARLRARVGPPDTREAGPFSENVTPFAYGTPAAHAIAAALNTGRTSRTAGTKLKPASQGVIWRGQLWFWADKIGYARGPWSKAEGRPALHHVIWSETHGRAIPPGHVIRFADGNPNNLAPENLVLATRNDLARENQATALLRQARERTRVLLARSQDNSPTPDHDLLDSLSRSRAAR